MIPGILATVFLLSLFIFIPTAEGDENSFSYIWGGYGTSLLTRSPEQRHNTLMAVRDINGTIIAPGAVFSFNALVGARDTAKGYTAAPIIDSKGEMLDSPGGGICQLASTIYNAGLLAGLQVIERHPHSRTVGHVPTGRDATISSWRKDLKLKNPFSYPLQLKIETGQSRLTASFCATVACPFTVEIKTERTRLEPETVIRGSGGRIIQKGGTGYSAVTRRFTRQGTAISEEIISTDTYPAPSRVIGKDASQGGIE